MLNLSFLKIILSSVAVTASVNASKIFLPINKLVCSQFLERIGNLVNSGLWVEGLDDRKFFTPILAPLPATTAA